MSRTFRNKMPDQDRWADCYDDDALSQRRANRLRKGSDGVVSDGICATTKRMTNKDIRRHNKALVKAGLKESNDED